MNGNLRDLLIASYEVPRVFYGGGLQGQPKKKSRSAALWVRELGCLLYYANELGYMAHTKRRAMNVEEMVQKWHKCIVGLAMAHSKEEADRQEASQFREARGKKGPPSDPKEFVITEQHRKFEKGKL